MNILVNGVKKNFEAAQITVATLVVALNLAGKRFAIEKNGEIVPRSQFVNTLLQEGDQLEIVGAVGGG